MKKVNKFDLENNKHLHKLTYIEKKHIYIARGHQCNGELVLYNFIN